jgi:hypothetical protein
MQFKLKKSKSKLWLGPVLLFFCAMISVSAHATTTGFNGTYDYATWTSSNTIGAPTASTIDGTQQTLTLYEPNDSDDGFSGDQTFNFSHVVASSGTVSFDWAFNWDVDSCCSGFNFYVNNTLYNLADGYPGNGDGNGGGDGSGSFSIAVNAGDTISFGSYSEDGCCGAADTVITNFDAPAAVPEPSSFALLSSGMAGFEYIRRRRRTR